MKKKEKKVNESYARGVGELEQIIGIFDAVSYRQLLHRK